MTTTDPTPIVARAAAGTSEDRKALARKAIHGFCSIESHGAWHGECATHGISVSSVLEALGPRLHELLETDFGTTLIRQARQIDAANRRRRP